MSKAKRIVICGFPRSGTTMLHLMCYSTLVARQYPEERAVKNLPKVPKITEITKRPQDIFGMTSDRRRDQVHHYIVMIRDPRDVLCSIHPLTEGRPMVGWQESLRVSRKQNGIVGTTPGLVEYMPYVERAKRRGEMIVRYEDLVRDPDNIQARICERYGIDNVDLFSNFHHYEYEFPEHLKATAGGIRPPSEEKVGRWQQHKGYILEKCKANPDLMYWIGKLGY